MKMKPLLQSDRTSQSYKEATITIIEISCYYIHVAFIIILILHNVKFNSKFILLFVIIMKCLSRFATRCINYLYIVRVEGPGMSSIIATSCFCVVIRYTLNFLLVFPFEGGRSWICARHLQQNSVMIETFYHTYY